MSNIINNRYEFVYFFDVENGNPNGDPDAGNMPRIDPETNHGIVTDVCLKRKVRNYVQMVKNDAPPFKIFIKEKAVLNQLIEEAYELGEDVKKALAEYEAWKKNKKSPKPKHHYEDLAKLWMCDTYYDTRAFGAVMSTGDKETGDKEKGEQEEKSKIKKTAGQVRGPIQFGFARSVEPIVPLECSITRMAVTNEKDLEKERTMGRKHIIPYALYRMHGYICPNFALRDLERKIYGTGFSESDLTLFWEVLEKMFWCDASSARQPMCARKLVIFKHDLPLGNAPAHKLFELVTVRRATDESKPARQFFDYKVEVNKAVPQGVVLEEKL